MPFIAPAADGTTPEGIFNVKDYGATGDYTTDDTAAIQAAHTAALAYGTGGTVPYGYGMGQVYFPPGRYKVTSAIDWNPTTVDYTQIAWHGAGMSQSQIYYTGTGTMLEVEHENLVNYGFAQFRDMAFHGEDGPTGTQRALWLTGKNLTGHYMTLIERCNFFGWQTAIEGDGALICQIDKCLIENVTFGVKLLGTSAPLGANANVIRDTRILGYQSGLTYYGTCIHLDDGSGLIVAGCNIEFFDTGIYLGANVDGTNPNVIRDCWIEAGQTYSIDCDAGSGMTLIEGCGFGVSGARVKVRGSAGPVLMRGCSRAVLTNDAGSQYVRITNCQNVSVSNSGSNLTQTDNF